MFAKPLLILTITLVITGCAPSPTPAQPTSLMNISAASEDQWPTYSNKEYGFELKYPPDWFMEKCGLNSVIIGNNQIGSGHCGDAGPPLQGNPIIDTEGLIEISLTGYDDVASAIKDHIQDFKTATQESITLADTPAVQIQGIVRQNPLGGNAQETIVFVSHGGKVFVLKNTIQNKAYKDTFYLILSTFKFRY
jgi:hypothetical protein